MTVKRAVDACEALEVATLSSPVDDGELRQVGTREDKRIPRDINIEKQCVLIKNTVTEVVIMGWFRSRPQGQRSLQCYLRSKCIRQMTNDSNEYRLADMSKENNELQCSVHVKYSTKSVMRNLTYKLECVH